VHKLKIGFETEGFVSEDVQKAIDAAIQAKGPSGLKEAYEIATDVSGVEKGNLFFFKLKPDISGRTYLAIENSEKTVLTFLGRAPTVDDVILS
jgi:hypothetical protein